MQLVSDFVQQLHSHQQVQIGLAPLQPIANKMANIKKVQSSLIARKI
jgi:hypothetical protein